MRDRLVYDVKHNICNLFCCPLRHSSKYSCGTDLSVAVLEAINIYLIQGKPVVSRDKTHEYRRVLSLEARSVRLFLKDFIVFLQEKIKTFAKNYIGIISIKTC